MVGKRVLGSVFVIAAIWAVMTFCRFDPTLIKAVCYFSGWLASNYVVQLVINEELQRIADLDEYRKGDGIYEEHKFLKLGKYIRWNALFLLIGVLMFVIFEYVLV